MVLKPVIMSYGTTEIKSEIESEKDRDFYTIKQYTIYLFKIIQSPNEKNLQEQEISNTTK